MLAVAHAFQQATDWHSMEPQGLGTPIPAERAPMAADELGSRHRPRDARAADDGVEDLLGRVHRVRRAAQHAGLGRGPRVARHAAGAEQGRGRARDPLRPRGGRDDRAAQRLRAQELLLSRTSPRATRSASTSCRWSSGGSARVRARRRARSACASRARTSRRTRASCCTRPSRGMTRRGPEPRRHAAAGDRLRARHALGGRGGRVREDAARAGALDRHLRRQHAGRLVSLRRQRLGAPHAGGHARHALRDQEPQLLPLPREGDRVRGAPPDRAARGRRHGRAGDAALRSPSATRRARCARRRTRRTTATSPIPTCCRWRSRRQWIDEVRRAMPALPHALRARVRDASTRFRRTTRACSPRAARRRSSSRPRSRRAGVPAKLAAQLGHGRGLGAAERPRPRLRRAAGRARRRSAALLLAHRTTARSRARRRRTCCRRWPTGEGDADAIIAKRGPEADLRCGRARSGRRPGARGERRSWSRTTARARRRPSTRSWAR